VRFANHAGRLVQVLESDADLIPRTGLDVSAASGGTFSSDPQAAYERWEELLNWAREAPANGSHSPIGLTPEQLGPPVPTPRQIFAIGLNYAEHAAEAKMQAPATHPSTFTKFQTSIAGPYGSVELPSDHVDWEVELVAVIGREARSVPASSAWKYVAGLTVGQDLSERVVQMSSTPPQFSLGKSFPGFGPIGPVLVTPDELPDDVDLRITASIDGELMQDGRTSQMIFDIPTLIERLSAVVTILPGDLIFSGTPAGVGGARNPQRFLKPHEALASEIEGIGQMRHTFTAAAR
jgi:2-keto-4-pentenoate hydratase/2-oxohepta-3-ene-1,7-dioic acid hydratase in catechol pathway